MRYIKLVIISVRLRYNICVLNRIKNIKKNAQYILEMIDKMEKNISTVSKE